MNCRIDYLDQKNILHVRFRGDLNFADRCRYVDEGLKQYPDKRPYRLLIDVRECINTMTFDQQKAFAEYLRERRELLGAKVAVLHKASHNPNLVIDSYSVIHGSNRELFTCESAALEWLAPAPPP